MKTRSITKISFLFMLVWLFLPLMAQPARAEVVQDMVDVTQASDFDNGYGGYEFKGDTYYKLKNDVTIDNYVYCVSDNVTLDLNGHTLSRGLTSAVNSGYVISLRDGTITLTDSSLVKTGKITGGNNQGQGGGVYIYGSGTFYMQGGTICGNTSTGGGGVFFGNSGKFYMQGGSICDNTSTGYGGGISASGATFSMTGGVIKGNNAMLGGGVANSASTCISGGMIIGNNATAQGGGMYNMSSSFELVGGTIRGNNAGEIGGGIYERGGSTDTNYMFLNLYDTDTGTTSAEVLGNVVGGNLNQDGEYTGENANNLYLEKYSALETHPNDESFEKLKGNGKIGITMQTPGIFTGSNTLTEEECVYFFSDNTSYGPTLITEGDDAGKAMLATAYPVTVVGGSTYHPSAAEGGIVTIKAAAPESGKKFKEWTWNGADDLIFTSGTNKTSETASFKMPGNTVTLTATYEDAVTYVVTVHNGSTDKTNVYAGAQVTIQANAPAEGKRFKEWTGTEGLTFTSGSKTTAEATFTMPAKAVELTATYEDIPTYAVTVTNGTADKTAAAEGATVTIKANNPEKGKRFKEWTWTGVDTLSFTFGDATTASAAFTMPAKAVSLTATYVDAPILEITMPTFDEVYMGYIQPPAKPITIKNTGKVDAEIQSATLTGGFPQFILTQGIPSVAAGETNTSYLIQPVVYDEFFTSFRVHKNTISVICTDGTKTEAEVKYRVCGIKHHTGSSIGNTLQFEGCFPTNANKTNAVCIAAIYNETGRLTELNIPSFDMVGVPEDDEFLAKTDRKFQDDHTYKAIVADKTSYIPYFVNYSITHGTITSPAATPNWTSKDNRLVTYADSTLLETDANRGNYYRLTYTVPEAMKTKADKGVLMYAVPRGSKAGLSNDLLYVDQAKVQDGKAVFEGLGSGFALKEDGPCDIYVFDQLVASILLDSSICEHKHTEIRDAKESTATEAGYTGDTYCLDCGKLMKVGSIIPAKGNGGGSQGTSDPVVVDPASGGQQPGTGNDPKKELLDNPMVIKVKSVSIKASKVKKKAQKLAAKKLMKISKAEGTLTYELAGVKKAKYKKYFKISKKTGKLTVKKGLKKGTYKVSITVTAAGNEKYKALSKTVTVKVKGELNRGF